MSQDIHWESAVWSIQVQNILFLFFNEGGWNDAKLLARQQNSNNIPMIKRSSEVLTWSEKINIRTLITIKWRSPDRICGCVLAPAGISLIPEKDRERSHPANYRLVTDCLLGVDWKSGWWPRNNEWLKYHQIIEMETGGLCQEQGISRWHPKTHWPQMVEP